MALRERIDAGFERWARLVFGRPRTALACCGLLALALGSGLPAITVDGSADAFLHPDDPVRVAQDAYRARFGREEVVLVAVETDDLFDLVFLERLRALHEDLERSVPQLENVTSLVNARWTHGSEDELIVEDLLEEWPRTPADLAALRERVRANPLYRNYLVSDDEHVTSILIELDRYSALEGTADVLAGFDERPAAGPRPFLTGAEVFAIARSIDAVLARHDGPGFRLYAAGGPPFNATLMTAMQRDIALFVALCVVAIALLLFALFRRISGVALPLVIVGLSLVCTLGTMGLLSVPITLPVQVLPSFLLAVGVCDSVHILTLFFRRLAEGGAREDALAFALRRSGLAVVLTSLTTAAGLASFAIAELAPVMHFGIFGPLGVLFALFFTLALLPALLAVTPLRAPRRADAQGSRQLDGLLLGAGAVATQRPRLVVAASALGVVLAVGGISRLRFSHDPMAWLPESEPVRIATEFVDAHLRGSSALEVQIETGVENGLYDPALLRGLDELRVFGESFERGAISIGKSVSLADVLKEIHQALNENRPESYAIPDDRRLVAQEFLLFENAGSDDLEDFVDSRFSTAGMTLRIPWVDGVHLAPFIAEMEHEFREVLGDSVTVTMTGGVVTGARTFTAAIYSMTESYAMAFLLVTPMMILLLGSLRAGLLAMIPNLVPIVLTLGLMGWLDLPLDFSTMMIGAIILGVAVDDTIHVMHGYRGACRECDGDPARAVLRTLETVGHAVFFTSAALTAGFLVYTLATMGNLVNLGVFTSFAIVMALLADLLLAPALLVLVPSARPAARPTVAQSASIPAT